MSLNVQYKDKSPCTGDLIVKNCTMQTALVSYPILIDNSTISLDPTTTVFDDIVLRSIDINFKRAESGPTTLGGYFLALKNKFNSEAHLRWVGAVGYELLTTGSTATQYALTNVSTAESIDIGSSCALIFTDPTSDLHATARELMFRTALDIAVGNTTLIQSLRGTQTNTPAVYESDYLYLIIATVLTVVAVFFVCLTFAGYSTLGRSVSMSPLETAKAFNAPLLEDAGSNADIKSLICMLGEKSVRYGAVSIDSFVDTENAPAAGKNMIQAETANAVGGTHQQQKRLVMADGQVVQRPRKGWKFL